MSANPSLEPSSPGDAAAAARVPGVATTPGGGIRVTGSEPVHTWGSARGHLARYRQGLLLADALGAAAAAGAAVQVRFGEPPQGLYAGAPLILPALWVFLLLVHRAYEERFLGTGPDEFGRVLRAGLALFTTIAVYSFATDGNISRSIVLAAVPGAVLTSLLARRFARRWLHAARARGQGAHPTLVVGRADAADALVTHLAAHPGEGLRPVAVCVSEAERGLQRVAGVPVVGSTTSVLAAVDRSGAEVVAVVSQPDLSGRPLRQLSWGLEERGVDLVVSPGILEVAGPRLSIRPVAGLSLLHLERPCPGAGTVLIKGAIDRGAALLGLLLLTPVLLAVAVFVKLSSPGPVLFRQTRVGAHGREFSMLKFRSMVVDAEDQLIDLREHQGNDVLFKLHHDPRVTRVGRIIRRFSVDELPQLVNVLRGDMSLVGPRPPLPHEVARYEPDAVRRLHVKPGITGLWQVSGRSDLNWEQSLQLDLRYVDNWSLALDALILLRTLRAVVGAHGAY